MDGNTEIFGIKEVARKANVSMATVDRVIHNRTGVAKKTRDKILEILKEVNYQPNIYARRLATLKPMRFASLIPEVSDETSFWAAPLNGIQEAELTIAKYGIKLDKFFFDLNDTKSFSSSADKILKGNYNGVLLAPSFIQESVAFTKACDSLNIPYVFINSDIPDNQSLSYIGPDLFQSGYLAAHLVNFLIREEDDILILNIAREMSNHHHVLRKEEGFRAYLRDNSKKNNIIKKDIRKTDYSSIKKMLTGVLKDNIRVVFVTNSRVSFVASYFEEMGIKNVLLVGYDFLEQNIEYLKKDIIQFLICQKPQEGAYKGIMQLYHSLVNFSEAEKVQFMPIDIITRENYKFYRN